MKFFKSKKGFTLVELMIAMTIFVIFTGILINSYTSIVKAQREANEYRILYVEARQIFDQVVSEVRNGVIKFDAGVGQPVGSTELRLVAPDGNSQTKFWLDSGVVKYSKGGLLADEEELNSDEVLVEDLRFFVTPAVDPYHEDNIANDDVQYQPKVTIYGKFSKELDTDRKYEVDMRTTVSSRYYNVAPNIFEL